MQSWKRWKAKVSEMQCREWTEITKKTWCISYGQELLWERDQRQKIRFIRVQHSSNDTNNYWGSRRMHQNTGNEASVLSYLLRSWSFFFSSAARRQALFTEMVHRNASKLFGPAPNKTAKVPINWRQDRSVGRKARLTGSTAIAVKMHPSESFGVCTRIRRIFDELNTVGPT